METDCLSFCATKKSKIEGKTPLHFPAMTGQIEIVQNSFLAKTKKEKLDKNAIDKVNTKYQICK